MAKLKVFVSHRTVEATFADLLSAHLSRDFIGILKFFVSTDVTSVPAGSQWYAQVIAELRAADLLLALCSNEAVGQPWINYEAGGACARGVDLIPLCYGGMTPEHLPVPLAMSEGVMLTDKHGLQKLYERIREKIGCDMPEVDFDALADEFKKLEREYARQLAAETAASRRENSDSIVPGSACLVREQPAVPKSRVGERIANRAGPFPEEPSARGRDDLHGAVRHSRAAGSRRRSHCWLRVPQERQVVLQ
jgi:hypothetical protein